MDGIKEAFVEQQRLVDDALFPKVLSPVEEQDSSLATWIEQHHDLLDDMLRKHRGILFRGFSELKTHEDFHKVVEATGYIAMDYIGG